jgi:hypothetical protein
MRIQVGKTILQAFKEFMILINQQEKGVQYYEKVFKFWNMGVVSKMKIKVIH